MRRWKHSTQLFGVAALALVAAGSDCFTGEPDQPDRIRWHVSGEGWATPTFDSSSVYFPTARHELVAVDKRTGQVRWRRSIPYVRQCPTIDSTITYGLAATMSAGVVVVMDDDIFGFDTASGSVLWKYRPPEGCISEISLTGSDGQSVFIGASRGSVYALDGATGQQRWRGQFLPDSNVSAFSPVAASGVVYAEFTVRVTTAPFDSGGVVALDAADGSVRWIHWFPRTAPGGRPRGVARVALSGALVLAPAGDGVLYALDRTTGQLVWQSPAETMQRPVAASGALAIAGTDTGLLQGLDAATGAEVWRVTNSFYVARIAADAARVYAKIGASMVAFDAATGVELWRVGLSPGGAAGIISAAAIDSQLVYAAANDGFYAMRKN